MSNNTIILLNTHPFDSADLEAASRSEPDTLFAVFINAAGKLDWACPPLALAPGTDVVGGFFNGEYLLPDSPLVKAATVAPRADEPNASPGETVGLRTARFVNAARAGDLAGVAASLRQGVDPACYNGAALLRAAHDGRLSVLKLLLDAGCHARVRDDAALEAAISGRQLGAVKLLLANDCRAASEAGNRALVGAAANGDLGMVRLLLAHGADACEAAYLEAHKRNDRADAEAGGQIETIRMLTVLQNAMTSSSRLRDNDLVWIGGAPSPIKWRTFKLENNAMSWDELAAVQHDLVTHGITHVGGGAAPSFRIVSPAFLERESAAATLLRLAPYFNREQYRQVLATIPAEPGDAERCDHLRQLALNLETMPGWQESWQDHAPANLHYVLGDAHWYVVEKDTQHPPRILGESEAGPALLYAWSVYPNATPELGYVELSELLRVGAELDLHYTPRPAEELLNEFCRVYGGWGQQHAWERARGERPAPDTIPVILIPKNPGEGEAPPETRGRSR